MSGIAGIYHLDNRPVDRALLQKMLDCVPHRGSDTVRTWTDGFIGLGHRQLCTTPESVREAQPAANRSGTCRVTLDGRIDNREELIGKLQPAVGKLDNPTDVELLLHAYDIWGFDCLKWVIGDFAFALWDSKRRHLFCGRDFYGVRPFYYRFDGKTFTFASECIQLFQNSQIPFELDQEKIAEWFTACGIQGRAQRDLTKTFFRGIAELPFGHSLVVDHNGLRQNRYWDVEPRHEIQYRHKAEYFEHFRHLFREAVRCRLRSNGPVGAELSGGFDSSSIVCMAHEIYRSGEAVQRGFATFSLIFDELACDERGLIQTVLKKYPGEYHFVAADNLCGPENFPPKRDSGFKIDSPDQLMLQKAGKALYQLAHERNIRVVLSGEGAENHVVGTPLVLDSLIRRRQWEELWNRLEMISRRSLRRGVIDLIKFGLVPLLAKPLSMSFYHKWMRHNSYWPQWFTPSFRDMILDEIIKQNSLLRESPRFGTWGRQVVYESLTPAHCVMHMHFGFPIERRFPYHDRRLVEYCMSLPPEIKYEHLQEASSANLKRRALQRHALHTILPEEIRRLRQKMNFVDVYRQRFEQLRDAYRSVFAPPGVPVAAQLGYLDPGKFWAALSDTLMRIESSKEVAPIMYLWLNRITQLEIWLQTMGLGQTKNVGDASVNDLVGWLAESRTPVKARKHVMAPGHAQIRGN